MSTTVKFEIGMEIFTATGHSLLDPGYTNILTWQALGSSDTLPKFTPEEKVTIQEVNARSITLANARHMYRLFIFCFVAHAGEVTRVLHATAGLFDRGGIDISHGETRHRDGRLDSCAYQ